MSKDSRKGNPPEDPTQAKHDDDIVVVPKGSSRARFVMTALLAVFVLTTFTVTGPLIDLLTGRHAASNAYVSWKLSDGTVESMDGSDFLIHKRSLSNVQALLSGGRRTTDVDDEATARHLLVDSLAVHSGIVVTNEELSKLIVSLFGSGDAYRQRLAATRVSPKDFEETVRSILRVRRFQMLLAQGFSMLVPEDVIKSWQASHPEYEVQTIEVDTGGFAEAAEAACPDSAALEAWYDSLPEAQKSTFQKQLPARASAEFTWYLIDPPGKLERLLDAFPASTEQEPLELARAWYDEHKVQLYRTIAAMNAGTMNPEDFRPFEEVQEEARAAALAYRALVDWREAYRVRLEAGEIDSMYDMAFPLGLGFRKEPAPHTREEWGGMGMIWEGQAPLDALFSDAAVPGELLPGVIIDRRALLVGRLIEKEPSRMSNFAESEARIRTGWITLRKTELAKEKLAELAAKFPLQAGVDAATPEFHVAAEDGAFQSAAEELGLTIETFEWFDPSRRNYSSKDPPRKQFAIRAASRYGKTVGSISAPEVSPDGKVAWMARVSGKRDPDPESITPFDYENSSRIAVYDGRNGFLESTFFSTEFLKEHYALDMEPWRRAAGQGGANP